MKKNYCISCGKEIKLKEILMQSIMFGIYCDRCGEISKASNKSKKIFMIFFCAVLILNIVVPINGFLKIFMAIFWCIVSLWIIQPLFCDFE